MKCSNLLILDSYEDVRCEDFDYPTEEREKEVSSFLRDLFKKQNGSSKKNVYFSLCHKTESIIYMLTKIDGYIYLESKDNSIGLLNTRGKQPLNVWEEEE